MKRAVSIVLLLIISVTMFSSCNKATDEKLTEMNALIDKYESKVKLCNEGVDMYPINDEDTNYTENVGKIKDLISQLGTKKDKIIKEYDELKESCTLEEAEEMIKSIKQHIAAVDTYLEEIKNDLRILNIEFNIK